MPATHLSDVVGLRPDSVVAIDLSDGAIVGVASLFITGPSTAELGVLVEDDYQRRGIGTDLAGRLLRYAPLRGITRVTGSVLSDRPGNLTFARAVLGDISVRADGIVTNVRATLR
jgi:RimJ/RimL family protein N-acetyltransferase